MQHIADHVTILAREGKNYSWSRGRAGRGRPRGCPAGSWAGAIWRTCATLRGGRAASWAPATSIVQGGDCPVEWREVAVQEDGVGAMVTQGRDAPGRGEADSFLICDQNCVIVEGRGTGRFRSVGLIVRW
uniref:Uncharacterized protein n=1 Tax=Triticum urartu TaxID=4572 RepID=A0A8R7Q9W0_TRIUA